MLQAVSKMPWFFLCAFASTAGERKFPAVEAKKID
jgi:hypothetical protein